MAKSSLGFSEHQIARRIKDGRGLGKGKEYRPWLYVQDVPSEGRSHRVYSHKTGRVHHLLSDLELAAFLVFEWAPNITDIREQFPLIREDTKAIAREHSLKHPSIRGIEQIMSSDFLVDTKTGPYRQFVIQVKPVEALFDDNTTEKLQIERRYWELKQIPWFLITEQKIDPQIRQNISWLYPTKSEGVIDKELLIQLPFLHSVFSKSPQTKVIDICKQIDTAYALEIGHTLRDVRTLTANGYLKFNINHLFRTITAAELIFCPFSDMEDLLHVANQ
ncbi:MAG: TnsA endonuclease N-terminal domain-containing protein [Shewanella sp.]